MLGEFFVKKLNTNDKTVSEMMTSNLILLLRKGLESSQPAKLGFEPRSFHSKNGDPLDEQKMSLTFNYFNGLKLSIVKLIF